VDELNLLVGKDLWGAEVMTEAEVREIMYRNDIVTDDSLDEGEAA
jgi:hypothetical protein